MRRYRWFLLLVVWLVSACGTLGGKALRGSSISFNKALQQALSEQMLLNLVRVRYGETPVFVEVTSVSSQYSSSGSLSAGASLQAGPESYSLGLGFSYAVRPTFTFVPLQGEEFAKRLLSPIPIEHLVILLNSGWRVDRVLRICVQGMNGIPNAPTASGPTPSKKPRYERFLSLVKDMEVLRKRGLLKFTYLEREGSARPVMWVAEEARRTQEWKRISEALGLRPAPYYFLVSVYGKTEPNAVSVETRSLIGVLFYLSHGIEVPKEHLDSGAAVRTYTENGTEFSWDEMLGDIFRVRVSKGLPRDALVAIRHRGWWFYISDEDASTKSTFVLLQQLFALEASKGKALSPLLTLPISP